MFNTRFTVYWTSLKTNDYIILLRKKNKVRYNAIKKWSLNERLHESNDTPTHFGLVKKQFQKPFLVVNYTCFPIAHYVTNVIFYTLF